MKLFFLIILFLKTSSYSLERVCRSPEGKTVDWYVIFLYPQNSSPEKKLMYGYIDDTSFTLKDYEYNEKTFPPTKITQYTLNEDDVNFNYFFWNDDTTCKNESKTSAPDSRAHAKGSLVYDENKGAFLLHSLPRFPTRTKDGEVLTELPSNGGQYAQSFLCLSVNKNYAERIVEILNIINVSNNKSVKKDRVNASPNEWVTKLIKNVFNTRYPSEKDTTIETLKGKKFRFFSKGPLKRIIPYDTTLREEYEDSFYVRTWTRPKSAPPLCEAYSLYNVLNVKFNDYSFKETKEHSKWAVSINKNIVCFGDLNHTASQSKRGGNIVCFINEILSNIMKKAVQSHDECEK